MFPLSGQLRFETGVQRRQASQSGGQRSSGPSQQIFPSASQHASTSQLDLPPDGSGLLLSSGVDMMWEQEDLPPISELEQLKAEMRGMRAEMNDMRAEIRRYQEDDTRFAKRVKEVVGSMSLSFNDD